MTDTYTATLDRIIDGQTAVLLLEDDDEVVDQLQVDVGQLPAESHHDGAVLEVVVDENTLREAEYQPDETRSRRESAQERLDRLSDRLSDRD